MSEPHPAIPPPARLTRWTRVFRDFWAETDLPPLLAQRRRSDVKSTSSTSRRTGPNVADSSLSSTPTAGETVAVQAANQRLMTKRCGPADVASSRETCSKKPASVSVGAGCEVASLPRVDQVPMCMLCARDAPDQRFRGIEGQICCPGESVLPSRQCFGLL